MPNISLLWLCTYLCLHNKLWILSHIRKKLCLTIRLCSDILRLKSWHVFEYGPLHRESSVLTNIPYVTCQIFEKICSTIRLCTDTLCLKVWHWLDCDSSAITTVPCMLYHVCTYLCLLIKLWILQNMTKLRPTTCLCSVSLGVKSWHPNSLQWFDLNWGLVDCESSAVTSAPSSTYLCLSKKTTNSVSLRLRSSLSSSFWLEELLG